MTAFGASRLAQPAERVDPAPLRYGSIEEFKESARELFPAGGAGRKDVVLCPDDFARLCRLVSQATQFVIPTPGGVLGIRVGEPVPPMSKEDGLALLERLVVSDDDSEDFFRAIGRLRTLAGLNASLPGSVAECGPDEADPDNDCGASG